MTKQRKKTGTVKYAGESYHQGDVQIFKVSHVSPSAKKVKKSFFARSERTGHVHALCGDYELYKDPNVDNAFYVRVYGEGAVLNHTHERELQDPMFFDRREIKQVADHRPTFFKPGVYRVGIQRRANPFEIPLNDERRSWPAVVD